MLSFRNAFLISSLKNCCSSVFLGFRATVAANLSGSTAGSIWINNSVVPKCLLYSIFKNSINHRGSKLAPGHEAITKKNEKFTNA